MGLLGEVFSFGDTLKRKAKGLLNDPVGTINQYVNNENDRARSLNQLTSAATDESVQSLKNGGNGYGPASQKLAGLLAEGYNPTGMFIGASAKTWDKAAAEKAQKMLQAGVDPRKVWKETGTFKGADGALRQEIDDSGASLLAQFPSPQRIKDISGKWMTLTDFSRAFPDTPEALAIRTRNTMTQGKLNGDTPRLPSTLDHASLYESYPSTRDVRVAVKNDMPIGEGAYAQDKDAIILSPLMAPELKSVKLHEIQHAIQQREGWAKGGSPESMAGETVVNPEFANALTKWNKTISKYGYPKDKQFQPDDVVYNDPEMLRQWIGDQYTWLEDGLGRYDPTFDDLFAGGKLFDRSLVATPDELYRRLAGEAEARATQARMNMNAAQRREVYPFDSYDVPVDQLIVRNGLLGDAKAIVWHGSPHKFTKFDSSKIGTGEGAQAYGHGLYVAESKGVGEDYAKVLASPRNRVADKAGVYIDPSPMGDGKYRLATQSEVGQMRGQIGDATQGLTDYDFPNLASAIKAAKKQGYLPKDERPLLHAIGEDGKYVPVRKAIDTEELLGIEPQYSQFIASTPGNLYKIDLPDEHIAKMLDWDKQLAEQPQSVIDALHRAGVVDFEKNLGPKASGEIGDLGWTSSVRSMPGETLYRRLTESNFTPEMFASGQKKGAAQGVASDLLRDAGVPGIRYLDGGSRGVGQGTSNFVVFPGNEDLLKILEINGKPVGGLLNEVKGPQAEALETARKNAVKMLGLPENNTPMDRAKALGFTDDVYHGTFNRFENFDVSKANPRSQYMPGVFTADKPELADNFGDYIMPLMQRKGTTVLDKRAARQAGLPLPEVDTIHDKAAGIRVTTDPANIRSRFAAFDPARVNENDLLGGVTLPMLGLLGVGGLGAAYMTREK